MKLTTYILLLCCFSIAGCANMQRGPKQPPAGQDTMESGIERFSVVSNPPGASVKFSSGESCTTPCSVKKRSDVAFNVTVAKEDYKSQTVNVTNNLDALVRYNRSLGKSKADIDAIRVPQLKLSPNPLTVTLEPKWSK